MCKTVVSDYAPLQVWLGCGVQIIFVQREAVAGGQQNEAVDVVELSRANWLAERCVTTLHGSVYTDVLSNTAQRREGSTGYAERHLFITFKSIREIRTLVPSRTIKSSVHFDVLSKTMYRPTI